MKILKGTGRFGCAVVSLAALAVLLSGCGAAPDTSGEISLSPDISRASGNGYTYYLIEDGTLMAWGESYSTTDYDQRQPIFHGAQSVWTRRFGTLVLDQEGDLWTSDSMGLEGAREQEGMWYVLSDVVCATGSVWNSAAVCADGSLWTWGRNASGELSNGEIAEDAHPFHPSTLWTGCAASGPEPTPLPSMGRCTASGRDASGPSTSWMEWLMRRGQRAKRSRYSHRRGSSSCSPTPPIVARIRRCLMPRLPPW